MTKDTPTPEPNGPTDGPRDAGKDGPADLPTGHPTTPPEPSTSDASRPDALADEREDDGLTPPWESPPEPHAEPNAEPRAEPSTATRAPRSAPDPGPALSTAVWERLRAPFRFDDLIFVDVLVDAHQGLGTARPTLRVAALLERLDHVLGPGGWDVDFEGATGRAAGHAVRCRLRVGAVRRAGLAEAPDIATAVADALRQAAALFGIGRGLGGSDVLALLVGDASTGDAGTPDWDAAREALVARGAVAP